LVHPYLETGRCRGRKGPGHDDFCPDLIAKKKTPRKKKRGRRVRKNNVEGESVRPLNSGRGGVAMSKKKRPRQTFLSKKNILET